MKSELERLRERVKELERQQLKCDHDWNEPEYEPEEKVRNRYEPRRMGVDFYYEAVYDGTETVPRWSRVCKKCGKKEYTYKLVTVAVKTETRPKF